MVRPLIILALLTQVWVGSAQVYFSKQIDWMHNYDLLGYIVPTNDYQNFLAVGESLSIDPYLDQMLLCRFDSIGEVKGLNVLLPVGSYSGSARDVVKLNGEFSLIMGSFYTTTNGVDNAQVFLIKINTLTGDTIWTEQYGKSEYHNFGRYMIQTKDGGYAVLGKTYLANNQPPEKILLFKIDANGNESFRREYTTNLAEAQNGWAITETPDSGFIFLCSAVYQGVCPGCLFSDYMNDLLVIKTDAFGNQQWTKRFAPWEWKQYGLGGLDIKPLEDSTFIIFGNKYYKGLNQTFNNYSKYMLIRLRLDGTLIDSISFGGGDGTLISSVIRTNDGNFLAAAAENDSSFSDIGQTGVLLKISPSLHLLWKREYHISSPGVKTYEKFFDAVQLPDRGFIICGRAYDDSTYQNGWLIRVDSLGCLEPGCQLNSAIEDPPAPALDIGITFSPNPTSGQVRLALTHEGAVLLGVRVLDLQGRVVSDVQYLRNAGWRECTLDLSVEPAGVYVVQVRTSEGWAVREIVVAR